MDQTNVQLVPNAQTVTCADTELENNNIPSSLGVSSAIQQNRTTEMGDNHLRTDESVHISTIALQCLSNVPDLTEYFLQDEHTKEINDNNPLGTKGHLVKEYAHLLKEMWSGQNNTCRPFRLKCIVGRFAPRFNSFAQQDAQELTAFLLDGLHEDLNRIKKGRRTPELDAEEEPSVEEKQEEIRGTDIGKEESVEKQTEEVDQNGDGSVTTKAGDNDKMDQNGSTDETNEQGDGEGGAQCATKAWLEYKRNNDSVIIDLLHGQLESAIICNECEKVSIKHDPFCFLSLPIPPRGRPLPKEEEDGWRGGREKKANGVVVRTTEGNSSSAEAAPSRRLAELPPNLSASQQSVIRQYTWTYLVWILLLTRDWLIHPWTSWVMGTFRQLFASSVTLEHCLRAFFSADHLRGDDMYKCERCKKFRNGTKRYVLTRLPDVLIIHLKRFRHEGTYNTKLGTGIQFPLENLDMSSYVQRSASSDPHTAQTKYDLCGVITHKGHNMEYGHYVAYCRNPIDQNWYEFDDSIVTRVSQREVQMQEAYVLFYERNGLEGELSKDDDSDDEEAMRTAEDNSDVGEGETMLSEDAGQIIG